MVRPCLRPSPLPPPRASSSRPIPRRTAGTTSSRGKRRKRKRRKRRRRNTKRRRRKNINPSATTRSHLWWVDWLISCIMYLPCRREYVDLRCNDISSTSIISGPNSGRVKLLNGLKFFYKVALLKFRYWAVLRSWSVFDRLRFRLLAPAPIQSTSTGRLLTIF